MLQVQGLSKAYGGRVIFSDLSFSLSRGERLGLVGRNGCGKSTLLRILSQEESPDDGEVSTPKGYSLGYLSQHMKLHQSTVLEEAALGLPSDKRDEVHRVKEILGGLGLDESEFEKNPGTLSGGFQLRIHLAKVLLQEPDLLILDEPTNYLDILSLRWLAKTLRKWPHELLLVTHDRHFMDQVCSHTMALHRGEMVKVPGSTEKVYSVIADREEVYEKTRQNLEKKREKEQRFIDRFRSKSSKASSVQSRIKRMDRLPALEKLQELSGLDFHFSEAPFSAKQIFSAQNLHFRYTPEGPDLLQGIDLHLEPGERLGIIGANGRGKTTLLRTLAGELPLSEGSLHFHNAVRQGVFGQIQVHHLPREHTILEEVQGANADLSHQEVRGICATMLFQGQDAEKRIQVLSGGERCRVLLAKLLATPTNLLFLDEPSHHLDLESVEALIYSLQQYAGAVVLVSHDEGILSRVATKLVVFHESGPQLYEKTYDEFLASEGWFSSDSTHTPSKSLHRSQEKGIADSNRKQLRREKAQLIQERSKELRPILKEISKLEKLIEKGEAKCAQLEVEIVEASEKGQGSKIGELAQALEKEKQLVNEFYESLEEGFSKKDIVENKYQ